MSVLDSNLAGPLPSPATAGARPARRRAAAFLRAAIRCSPLGRRVIWSLPPASGAVALTFDDGPDPDWTPPVLDLLARHGAKATFFLIGGKASEHPELIHRMIGEGHSVGTHTFGHENLRGLSLRRTRETIRGGEAAVAAVTGSRPRWFRPPFGAFSPASLWETTRAGVTTVLWNVNPTDYREETAAGILAKLGPLHAGDVVLLHDKSAGVVEALPEIFARIDDAGLKAMSLDEAFRRSGPNSNSNSNSAVRELPSSSSSSSSIRNA
jgi:peptidoglycan-N-acetylglucosamine deacetylase